MCNVKNIINYLQSFIENVEKIFSDFDNLINVIVGVVLLLVFILLRNKLANLILNIFSKIFAAKKPEFVKPFKESLKKPLSAYFIVVGVFLCLYINCKTAFVIKSFKIATILVICWALVNYLSNNLFILFHFGKDADDNMNTTAMKFISNILKIIIIAFAVVMIISELGYNINGLLTGIGVGGLAISLAAQDAVSNLISGFIILFDKPFIVGDFIQTSTVMGIVEEVTMRSTRIRTLEDSEITVPNSTLTDDAIINISRMNKRMISFDIGLTYSCTNELLKRCEDQIRQYLIDDENILPAPVRVNFTKLDDSSLNLSITCYANTSDLDRYYQILGKVNYKVKEIVESNGASFAFPSNSVYIENK